MPAARPHQLVLNDETLDTNFAEAYRALRADISLSSAGGGAKAILVASAFPKEGKTTTVINLGVIMAQGGARVLIVDADFRRPSLHHVFGFLPTARMAPLGLSDVILGHPLAEALRPTGFSGVSLLPAGTAVPNPNELLGSHRMKLVLAELLREADVVLIDSPPCALYSDALLLAHLTDGVLYVVRSGNHDRETQRRVHRQLQRAKARMLGVVFNGAVDDGYGRARYDAAYAQGGRERRRG